MHACVLCPPSLLNEFQQVVPHVFKDKVELVVLPDDLLQLDQVWVLDLHQGLEVGGGHSGCLERRAMEAGGDGESRGKAIYIDICTD